MRIAIISTHQHTVLGGTETYHRNLFNQFKEKYDFTEFPIFANPNSNHVTKPLKGFKIDNRLNQGNKKMISKSTYKKKKMQYIYSNFDIVIYGNGFLPKKWISHSKSIVVQHFDKEFYNLKPFGFWFKAGHKIASLFFGIMPKGNPFAKTKNAVFFCKETSMPTDGNSFKIPLPFLKQKDIKIINPQKNEAIWYARLEEVTKGIIPLTKIVSGFKKINIYGFGPDKKLLLDNLDDKSLFKGTLKYENVINEVRNHKLSILTSYSEGFAFTIVESLSAGRPVIAFDTFDSIKFFEKSKAVFSFPLNDIHGFSRKIKEIQDLDVEDYIELSKNAIRFARENLSIEQFKLNWEKIFNSLIKAH